MRFREDHHRTNHGINTEKNILAVPVKWKIARWANIFASMANIFAGTAQYLPAWLI
jgi:hypothetical protein